MTAEQPPPDEAERERIRSDLGTTLFVEAGAGAGKTSSLVARIVNLVISGVPITSIAAITFTEKAAAELRSRTRSGLEAHPGPETTAALERLDHAPIGTLHSFARRILFDFPIEAGLPPGFSVLDGIGSRLDFEEQWSDLLDRLLDHAEPEGGLIAGGRAFVELCEFDGFGVNRGARSIADDFRSNWDLVSDWVRLEDPGPLRLELGAIRALGARIAATPTPHDDLQTTTVAELVAASDGLVSDSLRTRLEAIRAIDNKCGNWATRTRLPGATAKWTAAFGPSGADALEALRADEVEFGRLAHGLLVEVLRYRQQLLGAVIGRFILEGATERAASGRIEFHDLLVLARRLLTQQPHARRILHQRYARVLLDEFQDTDPIQLEIAVRLTADPDDVAQDPAPDATAADRWRELQPLPGRLFIVGDPKQSIYRFRRADISQYLRAATQVGADNVRLSANFRSTRAVIDFANDVFGRLITFAPNAQPAFQALDACRNPALLDHGTVTLLGHDRHDDLASRRAESGIGAADALRAREAAEVAATVSTALTDGWPVFDEQLNALRPCRAGDICVLLPTRIALAPLEAELRRGGLSYRAENSSVVYASSEVRYLLLTLRAADDPTDSLALLEALRSPLYGCSDVEIWDWKSRVDTFNIWSTPPPDLAEHPVALALAHVRSIAERVTTTSAADLLASVADERRVFDLALSGPDARDVWRRLRFVIEQARAWSDAGGHGIRRYLQWAVLQAADGRVADTILPENDHDAVRVMTIHAAKGLEFPITIVAGMTGAPRRTSTDSVVWDRDGWMLTGRGDDGTFESHRPIEEQMSDAERRRLLYVACTRAVDHLVVSLHRGIPPKNNADYGDWSRLTSAELLWAAGAAEPSSGAKPAAVELRSPPRIDNQHSARPWADEAAWADERDRVFATAARRSGIAATRLAEELVAIDERPLDSTRPHWQRGRYGTSVGRAVHGVLQFCDLTTGADIDHLARARCATEAVIGLESQVAALARSALGAPIVRTAAGGADHWRELFVAAPIGDRVLEGYVDLLVRTPTGLVIVDYKTDQWSGPVQTAERVGRYRLQLAAYAVALSGALGEPITAGVLVRCSPSGNAEQIAIDDWDIAIEEISRAVR